MRRGLERAAGDKQVARTLAAALARDADAAQARALAPPGVVTARPAAATSTDQAMTGKFYTACYDAATRVTALRAGAFVRLPHERLAAMLDPRAWDRGPGIIASAFRVRERPGGEYEEIPDDDDPPLGTTWPAAQLLFEYARSDVASFENILRITRFQVDARRIEMRYELHDCLRTTIALATAAGGLRRNEGWVIAEPPSAAEGDAHALTGTDWWKVTVHKDLRVRDLSPNGNGRRYDLGEWTNATMGAALSLWMDDTNMMTPFT